MKTLFRHFAVAATLSAVLASPLAQAEPTRSFVPRLGSTTVELAPELVAAAQAFNLDVRALKGSRLRGGKARFPIIEGDIDLATAKAEIIHSGGLRFAGGTTVVEVGDFIIDTTAATGAVLTGKVIVNDTFVGRAPLFDLALPALTLPLEVRPFTRFQIPGVSVTLSQAAADALNAAFRVTAFTRGFKIGTATVVSSLQAN